MKIVLSSIIILSLFLFASCKKASCTAVSNPDCICTLEYDPVCGCNDVTYGNACAANCAEVDYTPGECP